MKRPSCRMILPWAVLTSVASLSSPGQEVDVWVDLALEVECPQTGILEKGIEIYLRGGTEKELPVQIVQAVLPDDFTSISVRSHQADELYVRHPALEERPGSGRRATMVASYGRYETPLVDPVVLIGNRPASKDRPLEVRFWLRPARAGTFRFLIHTATRSNQGFYSYYPREGPVSSYDEITLACEVKVAGEPPRFEK